MKGFGGVEVVGCLCGGCGWRGGGLVGAQDLEM